MNSNSILIVEDEKKLNQFLSEYMGIYFDSIYSAFDGEEGWKLYKKHKPDVIFTDINMPKIDGLELAKKIREYDSNTIIVIISAHTDKEKLFKAIELQLLTYIVKPIKREELKQTILSIQSRLETQYMVTLDEDIQYDLSANQLLVKNQKVELTVAEKRFLNLLLQKQGNCVSYQDISLFVYDIQEFSKDAISSLVKRVRKKVGNNVIINCFNEGYKIT